MKSVLRSFPASRGASSLSGALMLLALFPYGSASAQTPPVPSTFQDLYTELDNYLVSFNATLGPGNASAHPTLMTGSLKAANSNIGPQLLNSTTGMQLQLNALKAMGAQAIMVEVGFPMLYQPFLTSQGQSYSAFVAYYQGVAAAVRQAGLKLIVENDTLLSNDVQAGWDVAPFYATLNWTQYQQARAQTALTVAQTMQPDYLVVLEEPDTEAANTGQVNVNTPSGATTMLSLILTSVREPVSKLKVGAGVGTWLNGYLGFIQGFVALPVDFIDMHIYPVNSNYLATALQIASIAAAAGKPVSMTECWLWKARDSEINVLTPDQFRARDPFSFWAPLDAYFIQTMQHLASQTQMLLLDPFNSETYFAYQPYGASTENLTPGQILAQETSLVFAANQQALYASTGMSYYHSVVVPADTTPPSAPGGLSGGSENPTTAFLNWTAATDNVGVAGYYILRNGSTVGTTANLYYWDSGLAESETYTYWIEAFDVAGNISGPSLRINATTKNATPPTKHSNVAATSATVSPTGTDSTAVINAAISSAISSKTSTLVFAPGTYSVSKPLNIASAATLTLSGYGAKILQTASHTQLFLVTGGSNITIEGFDLIGPSDFTGANTLARLIDLENSPSNVHILYNRLEAFGAAGVYVANGSNIFIQNNNIIGPGSSLISGGQNYNFGVVAAYTSSGGNGLRILANKITNTATGINVADNWSDVSVSDNQIQNMFGQHGIYVGGDSSMTVSNNVIDSACLDGIKLGANSRPGNSITFSGNTITNELTSTAYKNCGLGNGLDFGAYSNTNTTASAKAGSSTLTISSTSAPTFSTASVGQTVLSIPGAGIKRTDLCPCTITAFIDANHVALSTAASFSVAPVSATWEPRLVNITVSDNTIYNYGGGIGLNVRNIDGLVVTGGTVDTVTGYGGYILDATGVKIDGTRFRNCGFSLLIAVNANAQLDMSNVVLEQMNTANGGQAARDSNLYLATSTGSLYELTNIQFINPGAYASYALNTTTRIASTLKYSDLYYPGQTLNIDASITVLSGN